MTRSRKQVASILILTLILGLLVGLSAFGADVDTTTAIEFSLTDPVVGQSVTVTWTVDAQTDSFTFTGGTLERSLWDPDATSLNPGDVTPVSGSDPFTSTYDFTANKAGTYTAGGTYTGCPTCTPVVNGSSATDATLAVNKANTSTSVSPGVGPFVTGQTVTFTATVSDDPAGTGVPTGTVTFYADGTPIAVDKSLSGDPAKATCTASFNAEDSTIEITATYNGDTNYKSSSGPMTLTVNQAGTDTSVASDKTSAVTGETVTFTATVVDATSPSGSGIPTGTVEFFANSSSLGSVSVVSGVATLDTSFDAADSTVSIDATYSGDANYVGSSGSLPEPITIDQASTTILITSDLSTATVVGEPYTVGGTVKPLYANGTHTTAGTVHVSDGTDTCTDTTLTWNIDHWDWSCSLTSMTAGSDKTITATFDPTEPTSPPDPMDPGADVNYETNKATLLHTVNQANTTTTVSSSVNPSVTGQGVTFTATISAVSPGAGTPANGTTVTFVVKDKNSLEITGSPFSPTLSGGAGQASTSSIANLEASGSSYTVTATFNPGALGETGYDPNYGTSTSAEFTQNVNKATTTTVITGTSLGTNTDVGEQYTVRGEVAVDSPGGAIPPSPPETTGDVEVSDGTDTVTIPAADLTWHSNHWTWSTADPDPFVSTTAGAKTLTATFLRDTDYQPSSDTDSHTVDKAGTTVAITGTDLDTVDTVVGQSYEVKGTVTVTSLGTLPLTGGTVTVSDGTDSYSATPDLSTGVWSCASFVSTTAGAKKITATYFGDANYEDDTTLVGDDAGTEPVDHQVNPASTTVAITSELTGSGNATVVGQSYTVSGTITPKPTTGTHTTTGSLEVSDGTDTCTDTTLVWNVAGYWDWSCDLISTTAGTGDPKTKTLTATYSGDSNYDAPAAPPTTTHVVNQAGTTVEITGTALDTATVAGETYTVSGRVTPVNTTGTHTNTGTVKVSDGTVADDVASIPLSWSVDHWEWSSPFTSNVAGASKTLTATFDPTEASSPPGADANYATSEGTESHTVNQAATTTTVTSSVNPSVTGEGVTFTFTATVVAVAPGSGTPADDTTVTFVVKDKNGTDIPGSTFTEALSGGGGQASTSPITNLLQASKSPYTVTATFDPDPATDLNTDPNYNTSTSAAYTQNVNKATTTTFITGTSLGTNTDVGEPYTVSGTVAVDAPGGAIPSSPPETTGDVEVSDGTDMVTIASADLTWDANYWDWSTDNLCGGSPPCFTSTTAGAKILTATYSGDANYQPSSDTDDSHTVDKADTTIDITSDLPASSTVGAWYEVKGTVLVTSPGNLPLTGGSVSVTDGWDTYPATLTLSTGAWICDFVSTISGSLNLTAKYFGDANFNDSPFSAAESHTVTDLSIPEPTSLEILGPGTACPWEPILLLARVTHPQTPGLTNFDGCVTWDVGGSDVETFESTCLCGEGQCFDVSADACCAVSPVGECAVYYTPDDDIGTITITAQYVDDSSYENSDYANTFLYVVKRNTSTTVLGSDTPLVANDTATFTVIVQDTSSATPCASCVPVGDVTITVNPPGVGTLGGLTGDKYTLAASDAGIFTFTYTPTSKATTPHTVTATYTGSTTHNGSAGSFDQAIIGRTADIGMSVAPSTAYVYQPVTIAVHVEDDTTAGTGPIPSGAVEFATDLGGGDGSGTFFPASATCALDADGNGTIVYIPDALYNDSTDDHTNPLKTITATYSDPSNVHAGTSTVGHLNVILRATTTTVKFATSKGILVNEMTTFTVKVKDASGVPGTPPRPAEYVPYPALDRTMIGITKSLEPKSEGHITHTWGPGAGSGGTKWVFQYYRSALDSEGGENDTITVTYTPKNEDTGIYTGSNGAYGKSISRRPTVTTITNEAATVDGIQYDIQVDEDPSNNGGYSTLGGKLVEKGGTSLDETLVGPVPPKSYAGMTKDVDDPGHTLMVNVTVHYEPNDRVHLTSLDSVTIDRSDYIDTLDPTDPSNDGSGCTDGCGDGGTNVDQIIFNMNSAVVALQATQMGLDAATIIASLFPNPVVTVGIIFESGAEIPAKDIVIAVLDGANLLLEVAIMAMETDLDGDGLPDTVENTITHTEYNNTDSDGDGMGDYDEISYCGGYYGGTLRPNPNISDSDSDGLMDGYELAPFYTDVCVTDTDCDTLPDGVEVACRTEPTADNGFDTAKFNALGYSYTFPADFADKRDQPNPREADTDGDGLRDDTELGPGDIGTPQDYPVENYSSYSPYVNDADSDGDGILDGNESTNGDAVWNYTQVGGTGTTGSGETHLCFADTDEDGLLDGEEEALFGRGEIEVHSTLGTITTPALDDDSDDDGLSDYEEQVVTGTDPLNWDSDDDGISDADELIATSGTWPARSFYQSSDPLDPDTDDDGLTDYIEYGNNGVGTGLGTLYPRDDGPAGDPDIDCPLVNDDDSDNDGLQDGTESWNGDDTITTGTIGNSLLQADTPDDAYSHTKTGETDFCNPDTDGDGLTDGEEVALLGGLPVDGLQAGDTLTGFAPVTPKGVSTVFGDDGADLDPTIPALDDDSDNDGLSDYEEVNITGTDPLDQDSDNDTLSDANELIATGGTWPNRTFIQESDPLDPDTDDDDLYDQIEYPGSGLGTTRGTGGTPDTICPIVNDDDSDDDGLQDGYEDDDHDGTVDPTDKDGIWNNYTIGNSGSAGSGETNPCDPDTDRDGLSDGEEEGLIARSSTWQLRSGEFGVEGATSGASTVPALDDDSDNDGLSDYEEVNITQTDPLDADSDDDTLSDANELIATGYLSLMHPDGGVLTFTPREFQQESDPLDPDTDDDDLHDPVEYPGSGLGTTRGLGGTPDNICPYVNDDDSDDDGLQDGTEDANHDGTWGVLGTGIVVGTTLDQAQKCTAANCYWETNLCNPDTDGDGLLDGEEVGLIGGEPLFERPKPQETFSTETPEGVSTILPYGTGPAGYSPPGTQGDKLGPYFFDPAVGSDIDETIPALDMDSDNDGLSDYEEVNITQTDPLDADSDDDTLKDADELIAIAGAWPQRTFDQESDPLDINTDDDHLFDPQEYYNAGQYGSGLSTAGGAAPAGDRDTFCPYVNDDDSDDDSIQDGAVVEVDPELTVTGTLVAPSGYDYSYTHYEDFVDVVACTNLAFPGEAKANIEDFDGEQRDDSTLNVCDPDSDGDGLNDGEEIGLGTNPDDCDTDNDGRNDWHEVTGGGPIPTDPYDPDTDDDGLLDSAEVFGTNPTNPVNADTDGDGLCDGGTRTPWMTLNPSDPRVVVNPICKSCSTPGTYECPSSLPRQGSPDGIGDHPNPLGIGEDESGEGDWNTGETDPNQYDTDGDAVGDGIERLAFSTSRQYMIPTVDIFGRPITVTYPAANNVRSVCGCLDPLDSDSDDDGLSDGFEDRNHDGNFDFLPSEFDHQDPLPGPPIPYPTETNPCDRDTDHDGLTDWEERYQRQPLTTYPVLPPGLPIDNDGDGLFDEDPTMDGIDNDFDGFDGEDPIEAPIELTFNPTNPLDHDTDNDRLYDGEEVYWVCVAVTYTQLDNDGDALIDEDPIDLLDNDGDGLFDEDPVDFSVRFVSMLDPTCRDSDADGWMDGLDDDPCNSELIPLLPDVTIQPIDTDGDGFSDDDEIVAGTHPNDPEEYPAAYCMIDLDFDQEIDDRLWLEPTLCCGIANSVAIDIDSNVLIDARVRIIAPRDVKQGDFDGDGSEDDYRYVVEYAFSNYRVVQPRIVLTIDDYNGDLVIDHAEVVKK